MKKDEVIILSCSKCGAMSHAIKNPRMSDGYRVKEAEYVICKICFGELKWNENRNQKGKENLNKVISIFGKVWCGIKKNDLS